MSTPLVEAHITGQARLRALVERAVAAVWASLPSYDDENVDQWLTTVVPLVLAAQRQSVSLTEAYIVRYLTRPPLGVNPDELIGAGVRAGVGPDVVYHRSFVTVWTALADGTAWEQAVGSGLARARSTAAMDVQLSMRATADAVQRADDGIYGYRRVADGDACAYCRMINGAFVKSAGAFPLHNRCGCGLEPLTSPHPLAARLPDGVAVHEHGELGPVITDPAHEFHTL